jgi:hypothetical protein
MRLWRQPGIAPVGVVWAALIVHASSYIKISADRSNFSMEYSQATTCIDITTNGCLEYPSISFATSLLISDFSFLQGIGNLFCMAINHAFSTIHQFGTLLVLDLFFLHYLDFQNHILLLKFSTIHQKGVLEA